MKRELIDKKKMHRRWVTLGRREPVFDIYGIKTWGVQYKCPDCGFTMTPIEDHLCYVYCPNRGVQNLKPDDEVTE